MTKGCCTPSRPVTTQQASPANYAKRADFDAADESVEIPGGTALVGTNMPWSCRGLEPLL
jgi:hypothetical protein